MPVSSPHLSTIILLSTPSHSHGRGVVVLVVLVVVLVLVVVDVVVVLDVVVLLVVVVVEDVVVLVLVLVLVDVDVLVVVVVVVLLVVVVTTPALTAPTHNGRPLPIITNPPRTCRMALYITSGFRRHSKPYHISLRCRLSQQNNNLKLYQLHYLDCLYLSGLLD